MITLRVVLLISFTWAGLTANQIGQNTVSAGDALLQTARFRVDERTFVIAAIDYCGICNSSDETIRDAMATAAGTTREQVALQSLHQHSAPILDADAVCLLHGEKSEQFAQHLKFTDDIAMRTATAIEESIKRLQPVTKIVASKAKVDRVASNRRVPQPDGSIAVRASVTREAAVRDAPEGLIDPWLRTLTFFDDDRKLVQLHYYATHPQTFYGDSRVPSPPRDRARL